MEALTRRHLKELSRSLPSPTAILDIAGIITAPQKNHPRSYRPKTAKRQRL